MISKLVLMLDYRAFPVWLYDDEGLVIDTVLPIEWEADTALYQAMNQIQDKYDSLFINNEKEFSYVGFKTSAEKEAFKADVDTAVKLLLQKNNGKYIIENRLDLDEL